MRTFGASAPQKSLFVKLRYHPEVAAPARAQLGRK